MKKYIFLTNIPTPYRTSFYNALYDHNLNFEVFYMRHTEGDRNWQIDPASLRHPHYIDKGLYKMLGRFHVHFNPILLSKLFKAKDAEIIIGGGWNDPDVLILVTCKRMGFFKNQIHFWSEANYLTLGASNDNFFKKIIRKFVYNSTTGVQLSSGKMTEITLKKWGIKVNGFVPLPNTIEEEKFIITREEIEARHTNNIPVFLMPVRLHEVVKGIVNFFRSIGNENVRKGLFFLAGEGPDKEMVSSYIESNGLQNNIKLLGHCSTEKIVELYKQANVFVLPSFSDPSPLSLIEALKMQLPVLASDRCGNHFEAVSNKENGYLFDPANANAIRTAFGNLMQRRSEWGIMGEISGSMYQERFQKDMVIDNFIKQLVAFSDNKS